jgi:DNA-binding NtrC family response regulator
VVLGKLGSGFELAEAPRIEIPKSVEKPDSTLDPDVGSAPEHQEESEVIGKHPHDGMSLKEIARNAAREAERETILSVLEATRWNRSKAALILKVSYKALLYKIKDCGIVTP